MPKLEAGSMRSTSLLTNDMNELLQTPMPNDWHVTFATLFPGIQRHANEEVSDYSGRAYEY